MAALVTPALRRLQLGWAAFLAVVTGHPPASRAAERVIAMRLEGAPA
jgi:hypothetical protein